MHFYGGCADGARWSLRLWSAPILFPPTGMAPAGALGFGRRRLCFLPQGRRSLEPQASVGAVFVSSHRHGARWSLRLRSPPSSFPPRGTAPAGASGFGRRRPCILPQGRRPLEPQASVGAVFVCPHRDGALEPQASDGAVFVSSQRDGARWSLRLWSAPSFCFIPQGRRPLEPHASVGGVFLLSP